MGIVGESGSSKSVRAYTVMGILDPAGCITHGRILFGGLDLVTAVYFLSVIRLTQQMARCL